MANRALLVGINAYAESPLRGCVNDVLDMATLLTQKLAFAREEITLLLDGRATKEAILLQLRELVRSLRPGDRALFHFAGHGLQLKSMAGSDEPDGLDEAICPIDYSWDDMGSFLRDKDFRRELAGIPAGVTFVWVSDSCHSGNLTRRLERNPRDAIPRALVPPPDVAWQIETVKRSRARKLSGIRAVATDLRLALIAGCQAEQTSEDALFDQRANGALTYYLLRELQQSDGLGVGMPALVTRVTQALASNGFEQRPVLEGDADQTRWSFLAVQRGSQDAVSHDEVPPWHELFLEIDRRAAVDATFRQQMTAVGEAIGRALASVLDLPVAAPSDDRPPAPRGRAVVSASWWGFHIHISSDDLQSFVSMAHPINSIAAAIRATSDLAPLFEDLAATFIADKLQHLVSLDRGRGVYVRMSWLNPESLVPKAVRDADSVRPY